MIQIAANALITAAVYTLAGISFSIAYRAARFFNFAHGAFITVAPYAAYAVLTFWHYSFLWAFLIGISLSAALAAVLELIIFRPLRRGPDFATKSLIASLGLYTAIQAVISIVFGATSITLGLGPMTGLVVAGAKVTGVQISIIGCAVGVVTVTWLFFRNSFVGKKIKAVGSDRELLRIYGGNPDSTVLVATTYGAALAGVTGLFVAADTALSPNMGFNVLLGGVVAMVVGGTGSMRGIALAALLIAALEHATGWWISSSWERFVVFGVLLVFLLLRPRGVSGLLPQRGSI
jgi:branched-chain amino acid transport system permease protein